VGDIVRYSVIERFCRTLATMLRAGVAIPDAITAASDATNNRVYQIALVGALDEIMQGEGISGPLGSTRLFPSAASQMIKVGEQSGSLDRQLQVAADYYEGELTQKLKHLTSMIEPAIIVVVGVMVGFVAVALVSAMYGIFNQVKIQ
jgi:type IV pilus assembly protein PilC